MTSWTRVQPTTRPWSHAAGVFETEDGQPISLESDEREPITTERPPMANPWSPATGSSD